MGYFEIECFDKLFPPEKKVPKWKAEGWNIVTAEGLNHALNTELHAGAQVGTWHCALVESNSTPTLNQTYAVPICTECTAYDEASRPIWYESAASGGLLTNVASKAVFTMNAAKTIYGAIIVGGGTSAPTKGDAAGGGVLYSYALLTGTYRVVAVSDIINLTYQQIATYAA